MYTPEHDIGNQLIAEIAVLQAQEQRGETIQRNMVLELAQKVDEAFYTEELDGETAFALHQDLFFLWPDK